MSDVKIYVVGGSKNSFLPVNHIREKFFVDVSHDGDNIDGLNKWYCELTGLYYMWKHETAEIVGLEHYRRQFIGKNALLNEMEIKEILKYNDVIMYRMPFKSNAMQHMTGAGKGSELALALACLYTQHGKEIADFFHSILIGDHVYLGNMFICRKDVADRFCEFMFGILDVFDKMHKFKVDRIDGYISEYFMEPWFRYNGYRIYDCNRQVLDKTLTHRLPSWR